MSEFCNAGIFVYDDASTDDTPEICEAHPSVKHVIRRPHWDSSRAGRQQAEGAYRFEVFGHAMRAVCPDWVYCFDADERPELDLTGVDFKGLSGIRLRLFDFYITPDDEHVTWKDRT
jgi:glycosyltransferase involved in cell wall biosynthesis